MLIGILPQNGPVRSTSKVGWRAGPVRHFVSPRGSRSQSPQRTTTAERPLCRNRGSLSPLVAPVMGGTLAGSTESRSGRKVSEFRERAKLWPGPFVVLAHPSSHWSPNDGGARPVGLAASSPVLLRVGGCPSLSPRTEGEGQGRRSRSAQATRSTCWTVPALPSSRRKRPVSATLAWSAPDASFRSKGVAAERA